MPEFNKLVRERIPDRIHDNGEYPLWRTLSFDEYKRAILEKLKEEAQELCRADEKIADQIFGEVVDVVEVLYAVLEAHGIPTYAIHLDSVVQPPISSNTRLTLCSWADMVLHAPAEHLAERLCQFNKVLKKLMEVYELYEPDIEGGRKIKRGTHGGFEGRIFLIEVREGQQDLFAK